MRRFSAILISNIALLGCDSTQSASAEKNYPCPSIPYETYEKCGCNPVMSAFIDLTSQPIIPDAMKKGVTECLTGALSLDLTKKLKDLDADVKGCIIKATDFNEPVVNAVMAGFNEIIQDKTWQKAQCPWLRCKDPTVTCEESACVDGINQEDSVSDQPDGGKVTVNWNYKLAADEKRGTLKFQFGGENGCMSDIHHVKASVAILADGVSVFNSGPLRTDPPMKAHAPLQDKPRSESKPYSWDLTTSQLQSICRAKTVKVEPDVHVNDDVCEDDTIMKILGTK